MEAASGILLLTDEPDTTQTVASVLESKCSNRCTLVGTCRHLSEITAQLEGAPVTVALVDIDGDPDRMLVELDSIISRFANVQFVILSSELRTDLVMNAMRVGARNFIVKQSIATDLPNILGWLSKSVRSRTNGHGSVITVLSAGGGAGVTTIAINLANELGMRTSFPSLVVDMDSAYGAVGSYLGLSGEYGLADILGHRGQIDDELIISTALVYSPAMHVLLSPAGISRQRPAPLEYGRLDSALEAFQFTYYHTVVDAARVPAEVADILVAASKLTLLVFQLNIKELSFARAMLTELCRGPVSEDAILPVVNRYHRRNQMVTIEDAEKALGRPIKRVSNDFSSALRSINFGQPLAEVAPRSALRRDLQTLAASVANSRPKET